jgi:hypothetical protein
MIFDFCKSKYFSHHHWTTQIRLKGFTKFAFARTRFRALGGRAREVDPRELIELICPSGSLTSGQV